MPCQERYPGWGGASGVVERIQGANHDNGIKAWIICPGFVDTDVGRIALSDCGPANPANR